MAQAALRIHRRPVSPVSFRPWRSGHSWAFTAQPGVFLGTLKLYETHVLSEPSKESKIIFNTVRSLVYLLADQFIET